MSLEKSKIEKPPEIESEKMEDFERLVREIRKGLDPGKFKEKRDKIYSYYKECTERMEKECPEILEAMKKVAKKTGFKEILIDPSRGGTAAIWPEGFPSTILWSKKSVENVNILKQFAPKLALTGIKLITIHEREHLRGPAGKMIGAKARFVKEGKWKDIPELEAQLRKISLNEEQQVYLQSLVMLEHYEDLFDKGKCPDIITAAATEELFAQCAARGPSALKAAVYSKEIFVGLYKEMYPFLGTQVIREISEKDRKMRGKLLKKYQDWQKENANCG